MKSVVIAASPFSGGQLIGAPLGKSMDCIVSVGSEVFDRSWSQRDVQTIPMTVHFLSHSYQVLDFPDIQLLPGLS